MSFTYNLTIAIGTSTIFTGAVSTSTTFASVTITSTFFIFHDIMCLNS